MKTIAGIITFNPDIERLKVNIDAIISQVHQIIIIDNDSDNFLEIERLAENNGILIKKNLSNMGIAKALNQLFCYSETQAYEWVLTLDQDSICPNNLIKAYSPYLKDNIGIISPMVLYENISVNSLETKESYKEIDWCITSASLTRVSSWKIIGGFDDSLFIDLVDYDFSIRLRKKGFKIYQVQNVGIQHQLGNLSERTLFSKKILIGNHNPLRHYYYIRNTIYLKRKKVLGVYDAIKKVIKLYVKVILFEESKIEKLMSMNIGFKDGIKMTILERK